MLLSTDANVPTAAAIDLQESIGRDGGKAATAVRWRRKIYLKVFDETALRQFDVLILPRFLSTLFGEFKKNNPRFHQTDGRRARGRVDDACAASEQQKEP